MATTGLPIHPILVSGLATDVKKGELRRETNLIQGKPDASVLCRSSLRGMFCDPERKCPYAVAKLTDDSNLQVTAVPNISDEPHGTWHDYMLSTADHQWKGIVNGGVERLRESVCKHCRTSAWFRLASEEEAAE